MLNEPVIKRFLDYVKVDTTSDPRSTSFPSTTNQIEFAKQLKSECEQLGLTEITLDEYGYVMATLPANTNKTLPTIGFIAHMDTAPDFTGKNVKPQVVENYQGGDIVLNEKENIKLSPAQFPVLNEKIGETLITTDGTTLLGGDDKAGIAAILSACEYLLAHPEIPHGKIRIGFTPDEEVGHGADHFDTAKFGCDFAYTVDGSGMPELQSQTFNAASAHIEVQGVSVHPGSAKDKMKNSLLMAYELNSLLPSEEVPEHTELFEGFYLLHDLAGSVDRTTMDYIIRDHDRTLFENRKKVMTDVVATMNSRYGAGSFTLTLSDSYYNMKEIIDQHPEVMALANKAFASLGIVPNDDPIRGGTDGARLSFMGLPTPNFFTGTYNGHGRYEFVVASELIVAYKIVLEIIKVSANG
ncbi:MAG: peptidase T [Niameybacter sp.]|uniref:peptidase T n=1 Tax=Niameybacter sp. TaxID=2033640 RepID=UPI002FCC58E3